MGAPVRAVRTPGKEGDARCCTNLVFTSQSPADCQPSTTRFAKHTIGFFKKHGIGMLGFWNDEIGTSNQLTYILAFDSMADREQKWGTYRLIQVGTRCVPRQ